MKNAGGSLRLTRERSGPPTRSTVWIIVAMLPKPSTGLNRSASVYSIDSCTAFLGMTEVSNGAIS